MTPSAASSPLAALMTPHPVVLVFIPTTNELQRFVLSGAFEPLGQDRQLHFVLPAADAARMREAAPFLTADNSSTLQIDPDRFTMWSEVFRTGCVHYAHLSPSFALREGLDVNPAWRDAWAVADGSRQTLDAEFDAAVARILEGKSALPQVIELFDRFLPLLCIVPSSLLDPFCNEIIWACEAENVACLVLQSGWDNLSSKGLAYGRSPFIGCWGPQSVEHAVAIQRLSHKRTAALGAPHYEFLRPAPREETSALRRRLGVSDEERLVLFGGSFRQFDETSALRELDRAIERARLEPMKIVYRPHPWRAARRHEDSFFSVEWKHVVFDPDMYDRYVREQSEAGYIKRNVPMFDMAYLSTLISACDAVMSPMSTLLLESLILEKPTMAIAFGDGKHRYNPSVTAQTTHFAEIKGSSALIWCADPERLVRDCARLLKPRWDEKHARARTALLDRVVTREPGTYGERLAEFCQTRVDNSARKMRAQRTGSKRDTISHSYGAHLIARSYCGVESERAIVPGYWMHGWLPAFHNVHPSLIALHKREGQHEGYSFDEQVAHEKAHVAQWVARPDQEAYLRSQGYQLVRAIGLPIVYLPQAAVSRVPGSLLVLPPHGHRTHGPGDDIAEQYAETIAALRPRFSHVAVGLTEDDLLGQQWAGAFRQRGIDVFMTTEQGNPQTLARLRRLLATFEFVTTNGFGSHIALAAYCGARVSVHGPYAEFPLERMKGTHAIKMHPDLVHVARDLCSETALRHAYPFLFVAPDDASPQPEWGAREVGAASRVPPAQLRQLFGWDIAPNDPVRHPETVGFAR